MLSALSLQVAVSVIVPCPLEVLLAGQVAVLSPLPP